MLSQEDSTGTTNYIYDEITQEFLGVDYSNGGSLRYEYDNLGRIEQIKVQADALSTVYTTSYEYDAVGNLVKVTDPNGGETEIVYDGVNRLISRSLPNGITSTYIYQENTDWVQKITHTAADGTILASSEYVREGIGEPTKIIREDGSYVEVDYDDSLRVIKETYFDANDVQTEEIEYSYDADGNRLTVSSGEAEGSYSYQNIHQLSSITTATRTETYTYDNGGRIASITRDGETWNLEYNTADLITKITDAEGNLVVEYEYDSSGRRVAATDSNGNRDYLVAPMGNSDLESPHLVIDENGDLISAYVYGGSMPLLRLDSNGNPVYYLTDAMGSVIGLADGSGIEVADFHYDSFGNLRSAIGVEADREVAAGGDFRFQGHWLESNTDLYHFRARYYDPESGRFVSRDPVDLIETQPESSNPYQFVYNNPLIYSDPTGKFTISEIGVARTVEDILRNLKTAAVEEIKDRVIDNVRGILTNALNTALKKLIPFETAGTLGKIAGDIVQQNLNKDYIANWEDILIENTLCSIISNHVWKDTKVDQSGNPNDNGHPCGKTAPLDFKDSKPDFIIKKGKPKDKDGKPKAFLIGDAKVNAGNMKINPGKKSYNQFNAIMKYADYRNGHQYVPIATYVSIFGLKDSKIKQFKKAAAKKKYSVALEIVSFFPTK